MADQSRRPTLRDRGRTSGARVCMARRMAGLLGHSARGSCDRGNRRVARGRSSVGRAERGRPHGAFSVGSFWRAHASFRRGIVWPRGMDRGGRAACQWGVSGSCISALLPFDPFRRRSPQRCFSILGGLSGLGGDQSSAGAILGRRADLAVSARIDRGRGSCRRCGHSDDSALPRRSLADLGIRTSAGGRMPQSVCILTLPDRKNAGGGINEGTIALVHAPATVPL